MKLLSNAEVQSIYGGDTSCAVHNGAVVGGIIGGTAMGTYGFFVLKLASVGTNGITLPVVTATGGMVVVSIVSGALLGSAIGAAYEYLIG
jgi:hypothetical protein